MLIYSIRQFFLLSATLLRRGLIRQPQQSLQVTHRALERCLLKFNRFSQYRTGFRSSDLRQMSRLRDPTDYASKAKHRWASHIMRRADDRWTGRTVEWISRDCPRPRGRPPIGWADVFVEHVTKMRFSRAADARSRHNRLQPTSWMTIRDNDTNGSRVGARTYSEDEPSKHLRK